MSFCQKQKIRNDSQFGFRSKTSCVQAIAKVTEFSRHQVGDKMSGQASFIDLKKTFETLDQKFSFDKHENYGLRGKMNDLMRSF